MVLWLAACGSGGAVELLTQVRDDDQDGVLADVDCDDLNVDVYPDAPERCDGYDNDCNGEIDENPVNPFDWHTDADGDGYGDPDSYLSTGCEGPSGAAPNDADCDDADADVNPLADEICDDGIDNDCDGIDQACD